MPSVIRDPTPTWMRPSVVAGRTPGRASTLKPAARKAITWLGQILGADDPQGQIMGLVTGHVPVTRIISRGRPLNSAGKATWLVLGHLDDTKASQLNDMYKSGKGRVVRGYVRDSDLQGLEDDMADEFGNRIATISSDKIKSGGWIAQPPPSVR